jgi:predicted Zn-dependent protease
MSSPSNGFCATQKKTFDSICDTLFENLKPGEDAVLRLGAENSQFIRFNANRVRQNTSVEQSMVTLQFQAANRTLSRRWNLTGVHATDTAKALKELARAREDSKLLPVDPFQVAVVNNGESDRSFSGRIPAVADILNDISGAAEGSDLAGLFCSGPVISANRNNKGQRHWFETENFFMDYSLYSGQKAAKSVYAGLEWNSNDWKVNFNQTANQLSLLNRPVQDVKPGRYRTYFAPSAVAEISGILGWDALSYGAWKQGRCQFRKLVNNEVTLSPKFSLGENFDIGLSPAFNALGEVAPAQVRLIEKGKLVQFLISSRSAKEYGVVGNAAGDYEGPRSLEIGPGALSRDKILKELDRGLYLSNLHYLNWSDRLSARITGMTRYACFWVERGEIVGPIKDMRFDESLYEMFGSKLNAVTDFQEVDPLTGTYEARSLGGQKLPGLLVNDFTLTL